MPYRVKELRPTLQGEGANTGRAVVLCRFEGCNLSCGFCDTDFTGTDGPGGGVYRSASELSKAVLGTWRGGQGSRRVLCTGGEPLLQLDAALVEAFHDEGFEVLLETNGTVRPPAGIDWICVSPKEGRMPVVKRGDELKLPFPQEGVDPAVYLDLDFGKFYIQPLWGDDFKRNVRAAAEYCMRNPKWSLSLQMHRFAGLP